MVPGELRRVEEGPDEVGHPFLAVRRPVSPGEPGFEVGGLVGGRSSGEGGEVGRVDGQAYRSGRGRRTGSRRWPRSSRVFSWTSSPFIIRRRWGIVLEPSRSEFLLARVAVAADEVVDPPVGRQSHEDVRLGVDRLGRGGLEEGPGDLLGAESGDREGGPGGFEGRGRFRESDLGGRIERERPRWRRWLGSGARRS